MAAEKRLLATLLIALLWAVPGLAADGVIEIDAARAAAGGITASDTPGEPVTISESGSYVLTEPLDVSIELDPPSPGDRLFVTIDLNGHGLQLSASPTPSLDVLSSGTVLRLHDGAIESLDVAAGSTALLRNVRHMREAPSGSLALELGDAGMAIEVGAFDTGTEAVVRSNEFSVVADSTGLLAQDFQGRTVMTRLQERPSASTSVCMSQCVVRHLAGNISTGISPGQYGGVFQAVQGFIESTDGGIVFDSNPADVTLLPNGGASPVSSIGVARSVLTGSFDNDTGLGSPNGRIVELPVGSNLCGGAACPPCTEGTSCP